MSKKKPTVKKPTVKKPTVSEKRRKATAESPSGRKGKPVSKGMTRAEVNKARADADKKKATKKTPNRAPLADRQKSVDAFLNHPVVGAAKTLAAGIAAKKKMDKAGKGISRKKLDKLQAKDAKKKAKKKAPKGKVKKMTAKESATHRVLKASWSAASKKKRKK